MTKYLIVVQRATHYHYCHAGPESHQVLFWDCFGTHHELIQPLPQELEKAFPSPDKGAAQAVGSAEDGEAASRRGCLSCAAAAAPPVAPVQQPEAAPAPDAEAASDPPAAAAPTGGGGPAAGAPEAAAAAPPAQQRNWRFHSRSPSVGEAHLSRQAARMEAHAAVAAAVAERAPRQPHQPEVAVLDPFFVYLSGACCDRRGTPG